MTASQTRQIVPPRRLKDGERRVIEFLLSKPFPGRDELRGQVPHAAVSEEYIGKDPSVILTINPVVAPASVRTRVPVEARGSDADGMQLHVLLHVVDGYLWELEVFRSDSGPTDLPDPARLELITYYEGQS